MLLTARPLECGVAEAHSPEVVVVHISPLECRAHNACFECHDDTFCCGFEPAAVDAEPSTCDTGRDGNLRGQQFNIGAGRQDSCEVLRRGLIRVYWLSIVP